MTARWGDVPFAALTPALAAGIACAPWIDHPAAFWSVALAGFALAGAAAAALWVGRVGAAQATALLALLAAGAGLASADLSAFPDDDVRARLARGQIPLDQPVRFEATVADETVRGGGFWSATLELDRLELGGAWHPCGGRVELRVVPLDPVGVEPPETLAYGHRLRGWAAWALPRNFANPGSPRRREALARDGIFLVGRVKSERALELLPGVSGSAWRHLALRARARIRRQLALLASQGRGREAGVLQALVLGDGRDLQRPDRDAFQNTGTYHVLVVSGLHVGWISWVAALVCAAARIPRRAHGAVALGAALGYAALVGMQPSVTRAVVMIAFYVAARGMAVETPAANTVLASAFLLLGTRPAWLLDPGFQLSYLSVLGIVLLVPPFAARVVTPLGQPLAHAGDAAWVECTPGGTRRTGRRLRVRVELAVEALGDRVSNPAARALLALARLSSHVGRTLVLGAATSLAVALWLEPLLAFRFNRVSWIAPLANLGIVPLSSVVLALGLLLATAATLGNTPVPLLEFTARTAALLLDANDRVAAIPGAWQRVPTPDAWWVAGTLALVAAWSFHGWRRSWLPAAVVAALLGWIAFGPDPPPTGRLILTFLDVGQGDGIVLRFPNGRVWALDAGGIREPPGGTGNRFDTGESVVSRFLWGEGVRRLDRSLLSHPHHDHAGGLAALIRNFAPAELNHAGPDSDRTLAPLVDLARARGVAVRELAAGAALDVAGVSVRVLHPLAGAVPPSLNDRSLVLRLAYGRFSALLTGDLERAGESALRDRAPALEAVLLKVAHHGSRSATLDALLARVRPRWGVISAGRGNPFGHPSPEVLRRLARHGARPLVTLDQGAITVTTDGRRCTVASFVGGEIDDVALGY